MKKFLLAATILGAASVPVHAADPMVELPVASTYDWTGAYIGTHVGGGRSDIGWLYEGFGPGSAGDVSHSGSGAFGGLQAGYNIQSGAWVLGVEGDVTYSGIASETRCPTPDFSCETEIDWLGTARARGGYAFENALIYATGGFGIGRVTAQTVHPIVGTNGTTSAETGWVAGGGLEYGFGSGWSVKGEYMFYDLGESSYTIDNGLLVDVDTQLHTGRIGLNFKF